MRRISNECISGHGNDGKKKFDHARTFSNAAYVLNRGVPDAPHNMQMDLVFPQSVCAALALELYFKTLYLLEKGVDFKNNKGKSSHDFHSLFGSLDKKTRDMVSFTFDKLIRQQDLSYVKNFENASSCSIPRDLVGNLLAWKDVFVKLRYIHDYSLKGLHTFFFPEIENSVLVPIFLMRPEWRAKTSTVWKKV